MVLRYDLPVQSSELSTSGAVERQNHVAERNETKALPIRLGGKQLVRHGMHSIHFTLPRLVASVCTSLPGGPKLHSLRCFA